MKRKKFLSLMLVVMLTFTSILGVSGCGDKYAKKRTELIVENPETGEVIKKNDRFTMKYDGKPKIFNYRVKSGKNYLENPVVRLYINSKEIIINDITKHPTEVGEYSMCFEFNSCAKWEIGYTAEYSPCFKEFHITIIE